MSSKIADIFGFGVKDIIEGVSGAVDRFITTPDENKAFKLELEKVVSKRMSDASKQAIAEYESKKDIIVAELKQDDLFTKRARPSIIYTGLFVTIYNYCIVPTMQNLFGAELNIFVIPEEFWYVWGGVCGTYVYGRSKEKIAKGD